MKLFLYLLGAISALACSCNVLEIMNGNATKPHLFFAIFTGSLCVSSFMTFFNLFVKNFYGEDKNN